MPLPLTQKLCQTLWSKDYAKDMPKKLMKKVMGTIPPLFPTSSELVAFMDYGDLWGSESTVLIFYKSRAGIYGDLLVD